MRPITSDDLPWLRGIFARSYPHHDPRTTEQWMRERVLMDPVAFLADRTDNALCISTLVTYVYRPLDRETHVIALCADNGYVWEAVRLLRASIAWGRERQSLCWRIHADTGVGIDPLMRRLGVPQDKPRYRLELGGSHGKNGHH